MLGALNIYWALFSTSVLAAEIATYFALPSCAAQITFWFRDVVPVQYGRVEPRECTSLESDLLGVVASMAALAALAVFVIALLPGKSSAAYPPSANKLVMRLLSGFGLLSNAAAGSFFYFFFFLAAESDEVRLVVPGCCGLATFFLVLAMLAHREADEESPCAGLCRRLRSACARPPKEAQPAAAACAGSAPSAELRTTSWGYPNPAAKSAAAPPSAATSTATSAAARASRLGALNCCTAAARLKPPPRLRDGHSRRF